MGKIMKKFIISLLLLFSTTSYSQQDQVWQNLAPGKDLVKKLMIDGTLTEVGRTSAPLGNGVRSIGKPGSTASEQGPLLGSDFPVPGNVVIFDFNGGFTQTSGGGTATFTNNGATFDIKGFFGRENVLRLNKDETDNLSSTSADLNPGVSDFSFGMWVEADDWFGADSTLISQWVGGQNNHFIRINDGSPGRLDLRMGGVDAGEFQLPDDFHGIHHFAVTHDVSVPLTKWYIDGDVILTGSAASVVATSPLQIGAREAGSTTFGGTIQDFFFTKGTALTDEQVIATMSKRFTNHQQIAAGHILTADSFSFNDLTSKVVFWNMDSDQDGSVNNKDLNNIGTVPFTGTDIFGNARIAEFDGVGDYLISTDSFFNPTEYLSFGGWFKAEDWHPAPSQYLMNKWSTTDKAYNLALNANGIAVNLSDDGTATTISLDGGRLHPGWHHLAVTVDKSIVSLYIDGEFNTSTEFVGPINVSASNFAVGRRSGTTNYFKGSMQDLFFTNQTLSPLDIKKLVAAKITHSKNFDPTKQFWRAVWQREDSNLHFPVKHDWVRDMSNNDLFVNFLKFNPGSKVSITAQ